MVSLKPLTEVGYNRSFFRLPESRPSEQEFIYYTFDTVSPPGFANYWNIVGFRHHKSQVPLFDIQLLFVDDDELALETYHPEQDAETYLSIHPTECVALIQWFENMSGHRVTEGTHPTPHFHQLDANELASLHYQGLDLEIRLRDVYYYVPSEYVQREKVGDQVHLVEFPRWQKQKGNEQTSVFELKTFERRLLDDPEFWPENVQGLVPVLFDQEALEELIFLLKQRTYGAASQAFQS